MPPLFTCKKTDNLSISQMYTIISYQECLVLLTGNKVKNRIVVVLINKILTVLHLQLNNSIGSV